MVCKNKKNTYSKYLEISQKKEHFTIWNECGCINDDKNYIMVN